MSHSRWEPRVKCPLTPNPSPTRGEGSRTRRQTRPRRRARLPQLILPSPLEGIGLYTSRVGSPHLSVEPPDWWGARIGMDENPGEFGAVVLEPWRFGKYASCGQHHNSSSNTAKIEMCRDQCPSREGGWGGGDEHVGVFFIRFLLRPQRPACAGQTA